MCALPKLLLEVPATDGACPGLRRLAKISTGATGLGFLRPLAIAESTARIGEGSDFEALVFGIWGLGSGVRLFHDYSFLSLGETPWMVEVMVASEIWVFAYDS